MSNKLQVLNATKSFDTKVVLNNVSIEAMDNSIIVIEGKSGSGKTTLLRCICGFETLDSGSVKIDGTEVDDLEVSERGIVMMFNIDSLFPNLSNLDNILMNNKKTPAVLQEIEQIAKMLSISDILEQKGGTCSNGEQQRVCLARALLRHPKMLAFDEPLNHVDEKMRYQLCEQLKNIQIKTKATFIYVTHDHQEAKILADKIYYLDNGEIIEEKAVKRNLS